MAWSDISRLLLLSLPTATLVSSHGFVRKALSRF